MYSTADVLVTGGLGFIGKNYCKLSSANWDNKVILDKVTYASDYEFFEKYLEPAGWLLIREDVNNIEDLDPATFGSYPTVINFAAESHVDKSFDNSKEFMIANGLGTLCLAEYCRKNQLRLLHVSTDEVYGETLSNAADEETLLNPTNPYSATKAAADLIVQTYVKCFTLDAKIIRANNIFGPRQLSEKVIPKAIESAKQNITFTLHGSKDIKRHFLHVNDFSNALLIIIKNWEHTPEVVFNIGADESINIRELVEGIYDYVNAPKSLIQVGPDRPFNDAEYRINDNRLRSLGWAPKENFWENIRQLCDDDELFSSSEVLK